MSLSDLMKKKLSSIVKDLQSNEFKKEVGETISASIEKRVRLGSAADSYGAKAKKLKPLSDKYKEDRKRMKKQGTLSQKAQPSRSNLTKTGAMLDSLTYKIGQGGNVSIEVGTDQRKKAGYVADAGRPFMHLTNLDIKQIRDLIQARILKFLK